MTHPSTLEEYLADGTLALAGGAAILLQLGDPVVARGVAAHSGFARDPMGRLRNTLGYVYAIGLGGDELVRRAAGLVDRRHHGIPGATDADHQLWVTATLYEAARRLHAELGGTLADDLADEVYRTAGRFGTALQLPEGAWPASRSAFADYWTDAVARLDVGDDARAVAHDVLRSRTIPWWARPAMPLVRELTGGLLPESVRAAYGLPHHPRRYRASIAVVRVLRRVTPRRLRELPSRRLVAGLAAHGADRGRSGR